MKKIILLFLGLFVIASCSTENTEEIPNPNQESLSQKLLSISEVNAYIANQLKQKGDLEWKNAPTDVLYSAIMHGEGIVSIGYGDQEESFTNKRSSRLTDIKENIFSIVSEEEGVSKSNAVTSDDEILNVIEVNVQRIETIQKLQNADHIRYIDPIGYGFYLQEDVAYQQKSAGCNTSGDAINGNDFRIITPNAKFPWNFDIHKVSQAWQYSTGLGITVGLIDTGISANQNLLGSGFNSGSSNNSRTVQRFGTFVDSPWWWSNNTDGPNDKCGHGTQMASAIASPRNNSGMPVGVAYDSNLIAYRGTKDVVLNGYHERRGVSNALKALADRSDVKIISMSIGYPWSIGNVKDAIKYAYSKGKMIIAAGGTSTSFTNWYGVIFPASMSETVAVTGIKDNGYNRCSNCHDGNRIDFTIVMQRASDSDRNVPVIGFNTGSQNYVGGSSVATATTAGIAALVWARNPNMTRAQVLDKLKRSGEFYPNRNSKFGYGNINALKAVQ
ncbi:S8 family peptidase [Aquimarina algicola]|uniref:S8/S53 family peptidase n=1 Tax=Aquimarina algicola TaxID=2589995 RepID=A0A504J3K9_9FLAO|nr:S8/S53 family peptidase [Aquimarina algicola]TPN81659.1 S8/S53 family peptidase [Aquimarina algicola]